MQDNAQDSLRSLAGGQAEISAGESIRRALRKESCELGRLDPGLYLLDELCRSGSVPIFPRNESLKESRAEKLIVGLLSPRKSVLWKLSATAK